MLAQYNYTDVPVPLAWSYDSCTGVPGMAGGSSEVTLLRSDSDCTPCSPITWMMGGSVGGCYINFSVHVLGDPPATSTTG